MSNQIKQLRGQMRQIVKEILPETLTEAQFELLNTKIDKKLKELQELVQANLKEMNDRQRDVMSYLVRQVTVPSKE